jgi:hypothetical protein
VAGQSGEFQVPHFPEEGVAYVAHEAWGLLDDLDRPPKWSPGSSRRWHWTDRVSFLMWQHMEGGVPHALAELDVSEGETLNFLLRRFHVALPYDEAEREWLLQDPSARVDQSDWLDRVRGQELHVVAKGLQTVVYGRDLVRRWWAWRRQTDEFAGQRSLYLASDALWGVVAGFHPSEKLRVEARQRTLS